MKNVIASLFRSFNSRIIDSNSRIVRKLVKLSIWASVKLKKSFPFREDAYQVITNYDRNLKIFINPKRSMGAAIYWTGFHEIKELVFLHRFLKPDMVFVDIGANQGEYSLFAAKRVTDGRVIAFEPLPTMIAALNHNIALNNFKNVDVKPYGLSNHESVVPIFEMKDIHEGLATLFPSNQAVDGEHKIQIKVLDREIPNFNVSRVDVIKVDIEGGELFALLGAKATIEKYRPIVIVEVNEATYSAAGYTPGDVVNFLQSVGYQPFYLDKNANPQPSKNIPKFSNVIFVPQ